MELVAAGLPEMCSLQGFDDAMESATLSSEAVEEADKHVTETFGSSAADMPEKVRPTPSLAHEFICQQACDRDDSSFAADCAAQHTCL